MRRSVNRCQVKRVGFHGIARVAGGFEGKLQGQRSGTRGTISAVSRPLRAMPSAANAAAMLSKAATCAAATPLPATPAASPCAGQSSTWMRRSIRWPVMAATMPPIMARTAGRAGMPPICQDTAMAIGVVTAFGAIDSATARDPWSSHTSPIPLTMDVVDPATSATLMPLRLERTWWRFRARGSEQTADNW